MPASRVEYVRMPYVGEPYRDSGYGYRLADLMRARGDQEAAMHLQRGDTAARMWMNAGNAITGAVQDWQRRVEDNRRLALESRQQAQREEANTLALDSARRQANREQRRDKGEQVVRDLLPLARREDGVYGYDRDLLQRELESSGFADLVPEVFKGLDEQEAGHRAVLEAKRDAVASDAFRVLRGGQVDEKTFENLLHVWEKNGLAPADEIDMLRQAAQAQGIEAALTGAAQSSPKVAASIAEMQKASRPVLKGFGPDQTIVDERTGEVVREGQPKTPTSIDAAILAAMQSGDQATVDRLLTMKKDVAAAGRAPDIDRRAPIAVIGDDGKPVFVRPDDAVGKAPANVREQVAGAEIPDQYKGPLERAILGLPAARRGSIVQEANRLASVGDLSGLGDYIRLAAVQTENVDTKNQILGRQALLASLADTRQILTDLKARGVDTNILRGSLEDVARKLGTSTNPELVTLANRLQGTLINYRRAATGVAFSEKEQQQYAKMFPNYKTTLPVNLALIDGLEREARTFDREYWTHRLGKDGAALVGVLPGAAGGATDQAGWTNVDGFKVRVKP